MYRCNSTDSEKNTSHAIIVLDNDTVYSFCRIVYNLSLVN